MTAVLGLDIGGSTTRAVRAEDGRCVAEARAGSANIRSVGPAEAGRQLDAVLAGIRTDDVAAVCAGAAGADSAPARAALGELLAQRLPGAVVQIVHDARLILAAADLDAGIAVIAGTGSAGWGRTPDGREARAGGFGYLIGDEGSGYWTAREAVRHVLHRADTGAAPDPLGAALLAACGVAAPVNLFDLFYARPERAFWAGHAGVVVRLAASDPVAAEILGRAADALAQPRGDGRRPARQHRARGARWRVRACTSPRCAPPSPTRLAAAGLPDVRVIPRDPVEGAVRLARRLLETA